MTHNERQARPIRRTRWRLAVAGALYASLACHSAGLRAQSVAVRHVEGVVHGFLALRSQGGDRLATGDLIQTTDGNRVTSRLVFHFDDGSIQDETTVFSQQERFRLVSSRLVQKGPAFPDDLEMSIDASSGRVTVHYTDEGGESEVADEQMDLPNNLSNGLLPVLLKNVGPGDLPLTLSLVVATPKPRLVKLTVTGAGRAPFFVGESKREARRYRIEPDLGGFAGLVAPLVGKQPPDSHLWILHGDAPAFLRSESPLYAEGPMVRIELDRPGWSAASRD